MEIEYIKLENTRSRREMLKAFLHDKSEEFAEPLENRINVSNYAEKLLLNGYVFAAVHEKKIMGIIGGYANDFENFQAYESILVTDRMLRGSGAAKILFQMQKVYCKEQGMRTIYFTTNRGNAAAIKFYNKMNVPVVQDLCNTKVIAYVLRI